MSSDSPFSRDDGNLRRDSGRRPVRLPSPLAQAILLAIGTTALTLLVMQLTAPRWSWIAADTHAPAIEAHAAGMAAGRVFR